MSATPVTAGCRMIKSPAEIALLQRANDITIEAYKAALATLREGMTQRELGANISAAFRALGTGGAAMAIFGKYTAFPHGSIQPQQLREGDMVLIDDGCTVEGYQSDITRTTVFGKPTKRQREVWDLERKAQDAALAAARPGATCESVDAAARKVITDAGFGPGYKTPGLPHRTGHGIGLDGHEWTNFVKGNKTRIEPGMCFSDEPTIVIYGEFGVRLEDCMYITPRAGRGCSPNRVRRSISRSDRTMPDAAPTRISGGDLPGAHRQTAGGDEGVRAAGGRAGIGPGDDVPHRRALGTQRAHLRGGAHPNGDPAWVLPGFEEMRARELIQAGQDIRVWQEDESPYQRIAGILKDRGSRLWDASAWRNPCASSSSTVSASRRPNWITSARNPH